MKITRLVSFALTFVGLLSLTTHIAHASSFVVIRNDGKVISNVLADSDGVGLQIPEYKSVEISHIANTESSLDSHVSLTRTDGKISLVISSPSGDKEFDVTDWKDNLVEIEERGETQKLIIKAVADGFKIEQNNLTVDTDFSLSINPKTNKISVKTQSGERFISIMPIDALNTLLRSKTLTYASKDGGMSLGEDNGKDLYYLIKGQKEVNFFNFFNMPVDVGAKVSASTGEIIFVDEPVYMRVLRVLSS